MALALELKEGTKKSHSAAENTKFVAAFLRGVVDEESYRKLIKDFYFVYSAIEEEFTRLNDDPILMCINFPELWRIEFLKEDLRYYYGSNWNTIIRPSEACIRYVERIHEVADSNEPYLLVGHHYTRYLGDLSGGQILKNIAEKALDLPKDTGLAFYEFPDIFSSAMKKQFKKTYRKALDDLPLDESQKNSIIAEANYAFRLNMYIFDEMTSTDPYPAMTALKGFWKYLRGAISK